MPVIMPPCNNCIPSRASRWLARLCLALLATSMSAFAAENENPGEQVYLVPYEQLAGLNRYLDETLFPASNANIQRSRFTSHAAFFDLPNLHLLHRGSYIAVSTTNDEAAQNQSLVTLLGNQGIAEFEGRGGAGR